MIRKIFLARCLFLVSWIIAITEGTQAGGPLIVSSGKPVKWPTSSMPIVYNLDQGELGPFSRDEAAQMIVSAFAAWEAAPNTSIRFQRGTDLVVDVTVSNYYRYLDTLPKGNNPIVFDDDGSIIRSLYGKGSENDILGFGGPTSYKNGEITAAQAVFNGYAVQSMGLSANAVYSTVLHELGHFIGLDHSQVLRHLAYDEVGWNDVFVTTMLPTATDDDSFRIYLTPEDYYSVALIYPKAGLESQTGAIRGVVKRNTAEMPGVNIIARLVGAVTDSIYSTVSGTYSKHGGDFELTGLPPGSYQIGIEPIDPAYYDASSVGQYSDSTRDDSFINPPLMQAYHSNPLETSCSAWTPVTVSAGETVSGISINAQQASSTVDEVDAVLLPFDMPDIGAVPALGISVFQYILVPGGDESTVEVTVRADESGVSFGVLAVQGKRATESGVPVKMSQNGVAAVRLGVGGDLALQSERYFIAVKNLESRDLSFVIQATRTLISTETPTITPVHTPLPTLTKIPTPTPTKTSTPQPTHTPIPTPTAIEVNPALGLVAIDEVGGTYPRGAAVHNFDIGLTRKDGTTIEPGVYDGVPDPSALGPFLVFSSNFYPIARDIEFSGERDPAGNGSEGVYFLIGGSVNKIPPVSGRLGAVGGSNRGGIDADNNPANNLSFGGALGDPIAVEVSQGDHGLEFDAPLVDIEPAGNGGFYVLDQTGRIYAEGDALETLDTSSPPGDMNPNAPAVDMEIYRGRTVNLSNSRYSSDLIGQGAYILDRVGGIHRIGNAPLVTTQDLPVLSADSPIAYHDMEWIPNPAGTEFIGLGILRGDGIIFLVPFEDIEMTPAIQSYIQSLNPFGRLPSGFSIDLARSFAVEISDSPLYGKDSQGNTISTTGRRIGIFLVDGFGGIHTGGRSTRYTTAYGASGTDIRIINGFPAVPLPVNIPYFGEDVIRDLEIAPAITTVTSDE